MMLLSTSGRAPNQIRERFIEGENRYLYCRSGIVKPLKISHSERGAHPLLGFGKQAYLTHMTQALVISSNAF